MPGGLPDGGLQQGLVRGAVEPGRQERRPRQAVVTRAAALRRRRLGRQPYGTRSRRQGLAVARRPAQTATKESPPPACHCAGGTASSVRCRPLCATPAGWVKARQPCTSTAKQNPTPTRAACSSCSHRTPLGGQTPCPVAGTPKTKREHDMSLHQRKLRMRSACQVAGTSA